MKKYFVISYSYEHNYKWTSVTVYYTDSAKAARYYEKMMNTAGIYDRTAREIELSEEQVESLLSTVKEQFGEDCYRINGFDKDYFMMY
jgi:hypothetical protein